MRAGAHGRLLGGLPVLAAVCFLAGCTQIERAPVPGEGGLVLSIAQGTTGSVDELRIGLGFVRKSEYVDEAGAKKRGLVAGLMLLIPGNPPQEKDFDVHAGQRVAVDKYSLYVEEVRKGIKDSVVLRVTGGA